MIRALVLLVSVVALMSSTRSFLPEGRGMTGGSGMLLAFGFLLLAAIQTGKVFAAVRLPRLTGYLLTGLACGPELGGLVTSAMVDRLGIVNGVAVGLVALSAGSELDLRRLRPRLRAILTIGVLAIPLALAATAALTVALGDALPFMAGLSTGQRVAVAGVLGVVFASLSPTVALAMLAETESDGPVSQTVLGVVVLADIAIIVLFAMAHAAVGGLFGATQGAGGTVRQMAIEIFGSMGVGVVVAGALAIYIKRIGSRVALFIVAVCFVCAEVGSRLHLDVLVICLTAGLLLQNVLRVPGEVIIRELAPASLPIFVVFFAVAGARLHVHELRVLWPVALGVAAARAVSLVGGAWLGTVLARSEPVVRRWAPLGMLPQAGVSVGLAVLLERHFPTWGPGARTLILGVITINELLGPVLLRVALVRSGEAGKKPGTGAPGEH